MVSGERLAVLSAAFSLLTFLLLVLISSCSSVKPEPGVLMLRLGSEPTTLDPAFIVDVVGGNVSAKLFNGLVRFGEGSEVVPDIARSYTISPDGKTYTFHLRDGVRFTNGRAVTARDFKYSFERVLSPETKSPRTWLFERIAGAREFMDGKADEVSGIRAVDEHTLEIDLNAPFGPFLGLLAMPGGYVVPREEVERLGENFSSAPVGTGPYRLASWEHGSSITLVPNPDYFDDKPSLMGIKYRIIPEDLTAVAEFERGNLDAIAIPAPVFRRYTDSDKWKDLILSATGLNTYYLGMNCSRPPFSDVRLRRAVAMSIDRKRILDTIYQGRGELATGPVPDVLMDPYGGQGDKPFPYDYDPDAAKKLMAEAGYSDGFKMKIYIGADPETLDMVEVIQQYLRDVGIDASITQLEWSAYKQAITSGEADAFWLSWQADYPDPENFLYPVFDSANLGPAGNRAMFTDKEFDRLIEEAQAEPDHDKRGKLYREAQQRIIKMSPWVFFWHKKDFVVVQPWVEGYELHSINNADKGLGVSLKERGP